MKNEKQKNTIEIAEDVKERLLYGDVIEREEAIEKLGREIRDIENVLYYANQDPEENKEQENARARLLDIVEIFRGFEG